MFNVTGEVLEKQQASHTAKEIKQQPLVWQELVSTMYQQKDKHNDFIASIYKKHQRTRVIFTGAGTSAFIGDILVPELRKQAGGKVQFEAIPTTDIVSNPAEYLIKDVPTIMVSFARSGNSPESLASVSLGEQLIDDFYQVVITCNKEGELAQNIKHNEKAITILTPEKAHDQGFAMTSSFSCMMIAAYTLFTPNAFTDNMVKQIIAHAEHLLDSVADKVDDVLQFDFDRIAYLGSGVLSQLSHEASLKMLELTAGKVAAIYESWYCQ